jgi:hypothetical protein
LKWLLLLVVLVGGCNNTVILGTRADLGDGGFSDLPPPGDLTYRDQSANDLTMQ